VRPDLSHRPPLPGEQVVTPQRRGRKRVAVADALPIAANMGRGLPKTSPGAGPETIISPIGATTTSAGLEVYARLDNGTFPQQGPRAELDVHDDEFQPEWN
jgi:hypothetical protein